MIERRPFSELGGTDHGWLDTRHHFSFADYHDPQRMNWGALRVWNDDVIEPGTGFGAHPHANMEIITYVREGAITHRDSAGNEGRTVAGDVQVMSAGTGIMHSEYNREPGQTRIFQIWITPRRNGLQPSWGTRPFPDAGRAGRFIVLASGYEDDAEALRIHADARVLGAHLDAGDTIVRRLGTEQLAYLVPAAGRVDVNGTVIEAQDGAAIRAESELRIRALEDSELVLVELD